MVSYKKVEVISMRTDKYDSLKEKNISLRIDQDSFDLITLAAREKGMSRSAYMIQSTRRMAEKVILDQSNYFLDDERWNEFNDLLFSPPAENIKLRKLMRKPALWEHSNDVSEHSSS